MKSLEKNPYPKSVPNPKIYLEYNSGTNKNLNEAESKALRQIEQSKKIKDLEKSKKKEFKIKYNEKALSYKEEQKKKNQEEDLIKKAEYLERMKKMQEFNESLQKKNIKKKVINGNKNLIWIKKEKNQNIKSDKNDINKNQIIIVNHDIDKNNDTINLKQMDSIFIAKKTILKSVSNDDKNDNDNDVDNNFILKKTILKSSNDKIDMVNIKEIENKEGEDYIIDLRNNIENIINSQYNKYKNEYDKENSEDIRDQIDERINDLKKFRNEGLLPEKNIEVKKKEKKRIIKTKKFLSEFEKKRYIKALKNIFTERLGEHNIYIQNICSCGNLKKQLTAIVEKGNLTVYALTEVECANNCVFYKNKKEYMKNINDVLNSIKNIKYENFHNKYKEIN